MAFAPAVTRRHFIPRPRLMKYKKRKDAVHSSSYSKEKQDMFRR